MDLVFIKGLRASTTIGVYDHERNITQELLIDLEMGYDNRAAGASDNFEEALDYDAISKRAIEFIENSNHFLIEAVAENLGNLLLAEFPIIELRLTVNKPGAIAEAETVGVTIKRP